MIRYALVCEHEHPFEAWFGSSSDYDAQAERGLVECPICLTQAKMHTMMMEAMGQVRRHVEDTFDYVGDRFAKEARDIHDGRSEERGIYGEASPKEVKALTEDGIRVAPLPPVVAPKPKSELN